MAATAAPRTDRTGRRFGIAVAIVVGGLIALNLLATGVDRSVGGSEPSGVAGSSYGTQNTGLGALAALMSHYDHGVGRERGSLTDTILNPAGTVFVIEPQTLTES